MCFVDAKTMSSSEKMELNWQATIETYLSKIEKETKSALEEVKKGLERKGLPFDSEFKESIKRLTNAR